MFGVSRKKKPLSRKTIRTVASSSDDDDNNDNNNGIDEEHRRRVLAKKRTKKKKIKVSSSSTGLSFDPNEEEEDGEDGHNSSSKLGKKRFKHSSSSSSSKKSSRKSKRSGGGGLGYGGGMMSMMMNASDESASDNDGEQNNLHQAATAATASSSQYDVAALQKLKMEQKRDMKIAQEDSNYDDDKRSKTNSSEHENLDKGQAPQHHHDVVGDDHNEEEFIPLTDTSKSRLKHSQSSSSSNRVDIVLTGDEALAYAEKEEANDASEFDHGLHAPPQKQQKDETITENNEEMIEEEDMEEGNRQWEDTMARRAGVLPSSTSEKRGARTLRHQQHRGKSSASSIAEIKASLQPTISNLGDVSSDLASNIHRQQSTITSTKDELTTHQSTVQKHGKALEYYQGLRADLATWLGALRELDTMITLAEEALRRWEADMSWKRLHRLFEWGEDCTYVLEKKGLLESKFACNDDSEADQPPEVDEFGRSISSMAAMSRMKRFSRRQKMQSQRSAGMHPSTDNDIVSSSCINEDNFDTSEIDEWRQRYRALHDAIALIPNSVKDDYRSISNLCSIFLEWQRLHPEDYNTSFAEMSLVNMTSVLVRLELCTRWDMLGLANGIEEGESRQSVNLISDFRWLQSFQHDSSEPSLTQDVLLQIIEKQIVARLLRTLTFLDEDIDIQGTDKLYGVYSPFSTEQTKHLCNFVASLLELMSTMEENGTRNRCEKVIVSISDSLLSLMKRCVEKMTVPIMNPSNIRRGQNIFASKDGAIEFDGETNDAIIYASVVQAKELCTLVTNILQFWCPIIEDVASDLLRFVFTDIISLRIIPVVQTLQTIFSDDYDLGKTIIGDILSAVSRLLDKEEWMLQAAPLRVAAQTLGIVA